MKARSRKNQAFQPAMQDVGPGGALSRRAGLSGLFLWLFLGMSFVSAKRDWREVHVIKAELYRKYLASRKNHFTGLDIPIAILRAKSYDGGNHVVPIQGIPGFLQAGEKVVADPADCPVARAWRNSHLYSQFGHRLGSLSLHVNNVPAAPCPGNLRLLP
jgi:hypothetical protein